MGLTSITALRFYLASQLGMLAGTAVRECRQLAANTPDDVFSAGLLGSFVLGVFPLLAKAVADGLTRKRFAGWKKPPTSTWW
jgi:uncharacterized membrane protein YdjX (TVP38/TMEM64 family)